MPSSALSICRKKKSKNFASNAKLLPKSRQGVGGTGGRQVDGTPFIVENVKGKSTDLIFKEKPPGFQASSASDLAEPIPHFVAMQLCKLVTASSRGCLLYEQHDRKMIKQTKDYKVSEMNLIRSYNNWRRYRDTVTELNRLSARELNDLGISRGDISFVAKKAASAQ